MIYNEGDMVVYRDPETGNETRATVTDRHDGFPEFYIVKVPKVGTELVTYITAKEHELRKFEIKGE